MKQFIGAEFSATFRKVRHPFYYWVDFYQNGKKFATFGNPNMGDLSQDVAQEFKTLKIN